MIGTKVKTLPSDGCLCQESKEPQRIPEASELMQMNQQLRFTRSLSFQAPFSFLHHYNFILWSEGQILTHSCLTHSHGRGGCCPRPRAALAQLLPAAPSTSLGVCPILEVGLVGFLLLLIEETVVAKKSRSSQTSQHSMLHAIYKKEKKR